MPRVLARVNHPKNEWLFTEQWGVDAAVSPPHILTAMVEEAVTVGDLVRLIRLEGGRISIVEMTLARRVAVGRQGRSTSSACPPIPRSWRSCVTATSSSRSPRPSSSAGDEVVALATPPSERALRTAIVGDGMSGGAADATGSTAPPSVGS